MKPALITPDYSAFLNLSALFRTLLHPLMTAQLRVHDLDLDRLRA